MAYEVTKDEIERLLNIEGKVRGVVLKTDHRFILERFGEEKVKEVEKRLGEMMGKPFSYERDSSDLDFHPVGVRALSLLAANEILDLGEKGIKEMGGDAPKFSMLIKFFMRYLVSPQSIMEKAGDLWSKHWTVGKLEVIEKNEEEGFILCVLRDFELHPIFCDYLTAYLAFIVKLGVGEEVTGEQTKCTHRGDEYHEFLEKWK